MKGYLRDFKDIVLEATTRNCIIGGFNIFGVDDAEAVIRAAEEINAPVILMVNKLAVSTMSVDKWGKVLRVLANNASVPVCVHLDHTTDFEVIRLAVRSGFDSVMYDGSQLPLEQNIENTKKIVSLAHANGVLAEAEIGAVGYSDRDEREYKAEFTDPHDAGIFAAETKLDWMAISVGNVHRMEVQNAKIDYGLLKKIEKQTDVPLVIHGSTGISDEEMEKLKATRVAKVNIGTALRMAFGKTLGKQFEQDPSLFDRVKLLSEPLKQVQEVARNKMLLLGMKDYFNKGDELV